MFYWTASQTIFEWKDYILYGAVPLISSFSGAWAAFRFEGRRRAAEEKLRNVGAVNLATLTLSAYWNLLNDYQKKELDPVRNDPFRWISLRASPSAATGDWTFQIERLQFLLNSNHGQVVSELMLEQLRFVSSVELVRMRSKLVLERLQPGMAAVGFQQGQKFTQQDIENIVGLDVTHQLRDLTEGIFHQVDENLESLKEAYSSLQKAVRAIYPKTKFTTLVFGK